MLQLYTALRVRKKKFDIFKHAYPDELRLNEFLFFNPGKLSSVGKDFLNFPGVEIMCLNPPSLHQTWYQGILFHGVWQLEWIFFSLYLMEYWFMFSFFFRLHLRMFFTCCCFRWMENWWINIFASCYLFHIFLCAFLGPGKTSRRRIK